MPAADAASVCMAIAEAASRALLHPGIKDHKRCGVRARFSKNLLVLPNDLQVLGIFPTSHLVCLAYMVHAGDRIPLDCLHDEHGDCDPLELPPMQAPCLFPNLQCTGISSRTVPRGSSCTWFGAICKGLLVYGESPATSFHVTRLPLSGRA